MSDDESVEVDKAVFDDVVAMFKSVENVLIASCAYSKADKVQRCRERFEEEA